MIADDDLNKALLESMRVPLITARSGAPSSTLSRRSLGSLGVHFYLTGKQLVNATSLKVLSQPQMNNESP